MDNESFRKYAHQLVDWMADYRENIRQYNVKSNVKPNDILKQLPLKAPSIGEDFTTIFTDFSNIILPGVTHWQHPSFFAYYPSNTSPASILGEMLTSTLGLQCMSWQTSPAATELEERVMAWLVDMLGLPDDFVGVIQDGASSATLCSLLSAREKRTSCESNRSGLYNQKPFTVYCSDQAHSSVDKAVRIAGFGEVHLRKISVDENFSINDVLFEDMVIKDIDDGFSPLWAVASLGTTSSCSFDPLDRMGKICQKYNIWLHVDAAYAGTALVLPEFRFLIKGIEYVDSFVFNPHKWMLTNFDCSAYFVKNKDYLLKCFEILPEFLKTKEDLQVNNYRDWGIGLGRRFRALKLWFVIRNYGVENIQNMVRDQIQLAQKIVSKMKEENDFEILAPVVLNVICFRYNPSHINKDSKLNLINKTLLESLNESGKLYLSHTKLNGKYTLRMVIASPVIEEREMFEIWNLIKSIARKISL